MLKFISSDCGFFIVRIKLYYGLNQLKEVIMLLENKTAFITGAGRGIGREIALTMAAQGASIIIADIDEKTMSATATDVESLGVKALSVKTNISDIDSVKAAVEKAIDEFGRIDILVNNAAIFKKASFLEMTPEQWQQTADINMTGVFNVTRSVAPVMAEQGDGSIISIASVDAFQGCRDYSHYATTKAGVVGLSRTLAQELGPCGIRVNVIAPGIMLTEMTRDRVEANKEAYLSRVPIRRIGIPEDIANAALFLASNMSSYITGQVIHVNGGMYFG